MISNNYVETIASSIIHQLEMGTAPWLKTWQPGEHFMPFNPVTGNTYHGTNAIWLLAVMEDKGYNDNRWLTLTQAYNLGAQVNQGEVGTKIQYWKWTDEIPVTDQNGKPLKDGAGRVLKQTVNLQKPRVWHATVFNANQISCMPEITERQVLPDWERHQIAQAIISSSRANIVYQENERACYDRSTDTIMLPERRGHDLSLDNFYANALHELIHWTGHYSRLNRDLLHPFGSEVYAKEELRAEITSLIIADRLGIGHNSSHHAAYISSWQKILKDDPLELFRAAADAEKITRYLQVQGLIQQVTLKQELTSEQIQSPVLALEADMALRTNPDRIYLDVPFIEKDEAKALGAKWDRNEKSWYVPSGVNLEPLKQWLEPKLHIEVHQTPEVEFANALKSAGLVLDALPIMDGKLYRVPVEGDTGAQKSGAYVGFLDGHPAGYINNYKTGYEARWKSRQRLSSISPINRDRLEREAEERKTARVNALDNVHKETAAAVEAVWLAVELAKAHPYLEYKGVQSYGLRINTSGPLELTGGKSDEKPQQWSDKGELLVPIYDIDGHFWGAQSIDNTGRKSFPRGGRLHGRHYVLGNLESADKILIAEGYATAATLHEATGLPVIVAFHSGNLPGVAQAYRDKYPDITLIIAGDNDHTKSLEKNVGLLKAQEAAALVKGYVLLPDFPKDGSGSDWNDIAKIQGKDDLKAQLAIGLKNIDLMISTARLALKAGVEKQIKENQLVQHQGPEKELVQTGGRTLSV